MSAPERQPAAAPATIASSRVHQGWVGLRVDTLRFASEREGTVEVVEHPGDELENVPPSDGPLGVNRHESPAPGLLDCPEEYALKLAATATRLKRLPSRHQERLINRGYAVCDTGMRAHVDQAAAPPAGFPYPEAAV